MNENTRHILDLLSEQETAIAELYATFAEALPPMRSLWEVLVGQEQGHAQIIDTILRDESTPEIRLDPARFRAEAIRGSIDYIRRRTAETRTEGITPLRALALAHDLEHALIEAQFFTLVKTTNPERLAQLEKIDRETRQHRERIDIELARWKEPEARSSKWML